MEYADYVETYAAKTNDELLRLQLSSKDLTLHASAALTSELAKRGIGGSEQLDAFREREQERKEEQSKKTGNLFIASRLGIGRWHFGKAGRTFDSATNLERFSTTVFILVLWLPVIPTGSFLIEKRPGFFSKGITVLKQLPMDWKQVLRVWTVAILGLLALIMVLKHL